MRSVNSISHLRKLAFLFLALAVFGLGLQARLALYKAKPNLQITSAKLSTEKQSVAMLRSFEVGNDDPQSSIPPVLAALFSSFHDTPDAVCGVRRVAIALSHPTRSQMSCITALRRPPPSSI